MDERKDKISIFRFLASTNYNLRFVINWYTTNVVHLEPNYTNSKKDGNNVDDRRCSISRNNKSYFSKWHESFFVFAQPKEEKLKLGQWKLYPTKLLTMYNKIWHAKKF